MGSGRVAVTVGTHPADRFESHVGDEDAELPQQVPVDIVEQPVVAVDHRAKHVLRPVAGVMGEQARSR